MLRICELGAIGTNNEGSYRRALRLQYLLSTGDASSGKDVAYASRLYTAARTLPMRCRTQAEPAPTFSPCALKCIGEPISKGAPAHAIRTKRLTTEFCVLFNQRPLSRINTSIVVNRTR